jgi:hypothetical protein
MKNRLIWFLGPTVLGAFLCLYTQPAMAQAPAPDQGQQGEFNGENVDTGAATLDSGPEAAEAPEATEAPESAEAPESGMGAELSPVTASTAVIPAGVSTTGPGSDQSVDVEGDFDLQEIAGTDTPELK